MRIEFKQFFCLFLCSKTQSNREEIQRSLSSIVVLSSCFKIPGWWSQSSGPQFLWITFTAQPLSNSLGCQAAWQDPHSNPASSLTPALATPDCAATARHHLMQLSSSPVPLYSSVINQKGCWQTAVNANEISSVSPKSSWNPCTWKFRHFTELHCRAYAAA